MVRKWFDFKLLLTSLSVLRFRFIVCAWLLLYVVSCGGTVSQPRDFSLDSVKSLTLSKVDKNRITVNWELLKTEEGTVDYTILYTVYAETTNEASIFTKISNTETVYTLIPINSLEGELLPVDEKTGNRTDEIELSGLVEDTPYRIVVEARDASGNASYARLLAYTAAFKLDYDGITGDNMEANTIIGGKSVTVIWNPKEGAQSYLIQIIEGGNQFGGTILTDSVLEVVCPPDSVLCEKKDQFAEQLNDGRLQYKLEVNKKEGRYRLVIIPFNFRDLGGLRAVDEKGKVKTFTEEVLRLAKEDSELSKRLKGTLGIPDQVEEVQIKLEKAKAPTDLDLESTGSTVLASWGHGEGAEYYHAILTSDGVEAVTNTIDRYAADDKFAGGGYTSFSGLTANTSYTVTVQSLTVTTNNSTNVGGERSATISTKDVGDDLDIPNKIVRDDLILTSKGAGKLGISWSTEEVNSVIGYNVFYWVGNTAPNRPQYVAERGESNVAFTVQPNAYNIRVDVLSAHPEQEMVAGDIKSIKVYGNIPAVKGLGVSFSRSVFTNLGNKLYAIGYPLAYTEADTPLEAGGPLEDVSYYYRYRAESGKWVGYNEVVGEAVIPLQVDDLSDAAVVKAGYGKIYQVGLIASNAGGFVSDEETLVFIYKSFPEPFIQSENLKVETGDHSLRVTWPAVTEVNGSTVANYTVMLNEDPYSLPVQSITVVERRIAFEDLVNNRPYFITVIPNSIVTGNIFTALSVATEYDFNTAIREGSQEERILTNYTGVPKSYISQGAPEVVVNLGIIADELPTVDDDNQAKVTWEENPIGSRPTGYVLEYLANVKTPIDNMDVVGDDADVELSKLSWGGAVSIEVEIDDSGKYSQVIDNLNVSTATNVFRVRGVRIEDSEREWLGKYRYYALGTDRSWAPRWAEEDQDLLFSEHKDGSFKITWNRPSDPGRNRNKEASQLAGYRVSWGITAELGNSFEINNPDILSHTLTELTPGTLYYVKLQAKNDNTQGNIYNTGLSKTVYAIRRPGTVATNTITYSEHTINSFKASWDRLTDAGYGPEGQLDSVGYLLELSRDQGKNWQPISSRSDYLSTTETFSDLTPGIRYQVRVTATNRISLAGSVGEGKETWTLSLPKEVKDMKVSAPTYNKALHQGGFKVSWTLPSDTGFASDGTAAVITGYEVAYAEVVGGVTREYTSVAHEGITTEYVFAGLKSNEKYDIRIQAKSKAGTGNETNVSGWVPSLPEVVVSSSIAFFRPTASTIRIGWAVPKSGRAGGSVESSTPTSYRVEISPEGGEYRLVQDDYTNTIIIASDLDKSISYRARVTAKNIWGETTPTVSKSSGTPPSPVMDIKADTYTDKQVVFSWDAPIDKGTSDGTILATLSRYIVKYKKTADSEFIEIDEKSEGVKLAGALTGTTATVIGLSSGTSYTFLVVAVNSADVIGIEPDAPLLEQTTRPSSPENLRDATCVKLNEVDLAWDVSFGATYYKLYRDGIEIGGDITTTSYKDSTLEKGKTYFYKVQACSAVGCSSDSATLKITALVDKHFKNIINSREIPVDLSSYDQRSRDIFSYYNAGASLEVRYLKPGGTGNGSSFDNAAGSPKTIITAGTADASADKVYILLLIGGKYQTETMWMKNHVAIIGGVDECLGSSDTVTAIDGGGSRVVFQHFTTSKPPSGLLIDNTAVLYGVTITNGNGNSGGGMRNRFSSPTLVNVTFSGNRADYGGGMYNDISSPNLVGVTFSGNTATKNGGGMYNYVSSPSLVGVTFFGNTATENGGGMYNDNNGEAGPSIINGIFWGNAANSGSQLYIKNNNILLQENLGIYNSIVEGGAGTLVSGTTYTSVNQGGFVSESGETAPIVISFANIFDTDPKLEALANNGGSVLTHAIQSDSPAVNRGLHVKRKGDAFYYSVDSNTWYEEPDLSGTSVTLPADANDLTATDATGYLRTDRPDLGTYEAR